MNPETQSFDIRNFSDVLTKAKGGRYSCPNCKEPKLGISSSGKYQCWACHNTKAIARILTEPEREEKRRQKESERIANSKTQQQRIDEWLSSSAVNESITSKNLCQIEDAKLIASLLGWGWYSGSPGWYVYSCDPITGKRTKKGQFKPDTPISSSDEKDCQKYVTFPKGGRGENRLAAVYLALGLNDWQIVSERLGVPIEDGDIDESREDLGFWRWVLNHPEIPIIITEGVKKQACLLSLGLVGISVTGVWNGQTGKGRKLHRDLAPFIVPGRPVYFAFDSDLIVKEGVEAALRQLGRLCKQEKAEVFICGWNPECGKGVDDFVVNKGEKAFVEIYRDGSLPYSQWLKFLRSDNSSGGTSGDQNGSDRSGNTSHPPDDHPEAFYRGVCQAEGLVFENCVTAQTFDGWVYRREFGANNGDWLVKDAAFYHWLESSGYWEHQPDNKINAQVANAGEKAFKLKYSKEFGWQVVKPYELNSHKESAFKYCRSRLERSDIPTANSHLRAFKNCVVDMRTGARMPHDKAHYLTQLIPYDYEPSKDCPEVFRQFIIDSFGEDMLSTIRAFTSMFLDPTAPYGRFPHLIGTSGGGKGTLGRFWNSLFGEDGASSGDFSNLSTAEGRHQYLTGKSIFAMPDVGGYVSGLRAFYELVDNGGMSGRALFNPVGYFKTWNIRFWIASVDHLQIENAGDGWARRAYPIPVRPRTVKPDPDLRLKLEACKADVISWALAMPREERDRILLSPSDNERVINLTLDSALYGDSTKSFVDLCLRPSTDAGSVPHHLLHTWYVSYCKEHGYTPLGMSKFVSHLKTVLPRNFADRGWTPMINGKRSRVAAHWEYLVPVEGAFIKSDVQLQTEAFRPPTQINNPVWTCIKSQCEEGGLMEFEDFWNPPQPPDNNCDNSGDKGNPPQHPPDSSLPPEDAESGSTVQSGSIFAESLEQRNSGGVQGGSTVQGIGLAIEKNVNCFLDELAVEKSLTSISGGVPPARKLDSGILTQDSLPFYQRSDGQIQIDPLAIATMTPVECEEPESNPSRSSQEEVNPSPALQLAALLRLAECWAQVEEAIATSPESKTEAWKQLTPQEQIRIRGLKPKAVTYSKGDKVAKKANPEQVGVVERFDTNFGEYQVHFDCSTEWLNPADLIPVEVKA